MLHCTQVSSEIAVASVAGCHAPLVDLHLDARDADVLLPGDPGDDRLARLHARCRRGTSMRDCSLIGPRSDQPRAVQYAVDLVEAGHLELGDPLGRRHVAVQAGDDHPHREPVLGRQRLAVHADSEDRVAIVGERLDRASPP